MTSPTVRPVHDRPRHDIKPQRRHLPQAMGGDAQALVTDRHKGASEVTVVHDTSLKSLNRLHEGEFAITKQGTPAAYGSAGLSFDMTFDFRQRVELPSNEDFFEVPLHAPHGQHPKLGSLHASMMRAAQAAFQAVA